jgi:YD repeat-containing protein
MGRVTKVKSSTENSVSYDYNKLGQLTKVLGCIDQAPVYNTRGMLETLIAANGVSTSYSYDGNGRLTNLNYNKQSNLLKGYSLGYDNANNIITKNDNSYQYDALNRLIFASLKGKFENNSDEEEQKIGRTISDYSGEKSLEILADQAEAIELDYGAGSIGVDLLGKCKISKVELTPKSLEHRVDKRNLEV